MTNVLGEPFGQGWTQAVELFLALLLSSLIGLERELRQKSAGLRTHTLVGLGSALFLLISKYGFTDVLSEHVVLDPSRVAAQIVSGIGFVGGGLIFVRRDAVRGLTTAAVIWVVAAVGAACGAGLPLLALLVTGAHFLVVYGYPPLLRRITRRQPFSSAVRVSYLDGHGVLRDVLAAATRHHFVVAEFDTARRGSAEDDLERGRAQRRDRLETSAHGDVIDLSLRVEGSADVHDLVAALSEMDGVLAVGAGEPEGGGD
ncbi:MgtC/SapB family protein [Gandjariella thermophila]|uniref:Putative magnesium transport MgtC family protein n=1 Tax=Gandjariella thermophila TaxID=1931992 RepID=A0A4D4IZ82_9PSEU|nr:MgtC/SapB family protein [Gandjariella thermophila]GDY29655.1 putative magnesium transport MgtC family protein [Gandjariella thermophila]